MKKKRVAVLSLFLICSILFSGCGESFRKWLFDWPFKTSQESATSSEEATSSEVAVSSESVVSSDSGMLSSSTASESVAPSATASSSGAAVDAGKGKEEELTTDEAFLKDLAAGLDARWALYDENAVSDDYAPSYSYEEREIVRKGIQAELDAVSGCRDRTFEDSGLQELCGQYIDTLNTQMDALSYAGTDKGQDVWDSACDDRAAVFRQIAETYTIPIDAKYQDDFEKLKNKEKVAQERKDENAAVAQMLTTFDFQQVQDEYGMKTYAAVVPNDTGINFKEFDVSINLLDESGVLLETDPSYFSNWNSGQSARFEFTTEKDFASTQIVVTYWSDDQGNYGQSVS